MKRKRNKDAGAGQRAESSLLAQNDPSGANSRNRSGQLLIAGHRNGYRAVKLPYSPVRYAVSERVQASGRVDIHPCMEPRRISLYTQRNRLILPLLFTVKTGAESLARCWRYRNTAEAPGGEIHRKLSVEISKKRAGAIAPALFILRASRYGCRYGLNRDRCRQYDRSGASHFV